MEKQIADLVDEYEAGKVSRRGLIAALTAMAAGASGGAARPAGTTRQAAGPGGLPATPLCDLLEIDIPIIQASLGPWSTPELTASCHAPARLEASERFCVRPIACVRRSGASAS